MSRVLFVMLHPGYIRYYEGALLAMADAGHHVHVAFEVTRDKLGEDVRARRLADVSERITCGTTPPRVESVRDFLARSDRSATRSGDGDHRSRAARDEQAWESLATTVRLMLDYLRYFEPAFANAVKLRERAEKRLPRRPAAVVRAAARRGAGARAALASVLHRLERLVPPSPRVEAFLREQRPDLLLVTPLIELGSQQVDYVKGARRLGIRSALCVASWDNLTSKGLIRVIPDHVIVWNEAQKREAVELHGVAPGRVIVTGAQLFDRWFEMAPERSRDEFCAAVGLDPARPFVLYLGSSSFIAPDEVPFAERWVAGVRASSDPALASAGVLIRPHPANVRQWHTFDRTAHDNVALWPPIGADPNDPHAQRDYFESLAYSEAVVGVNTSAQLEAAIVGRPVLTVRSPEFAHAQDGTLHFQHLVDRDAGFVEEAGSIDQHLGQLAAAMRHAPDAAARRQQFVRAFIRPHGLEARVAPIFAVAIDRLLAEPAPAPQPEDWRTSSVRPFALALARVTHGLTDDRPLWAYAMRPVIAGVVHTAGAGDSVSRSVRAAAHTGMKRLRRVAWRGWYHSSRLTMQRVRRANKPLVRAGRSAGSAVKRVMRRGL